MKAKTLIGFAAGVALVLGGPATMALADDATPDATSPATVAPSDPTTTAPDASAPVVAPVTESVTPAPVVPAPVVSDFTVATVTDTLPPAPTYLAVSWNIPGGNASAPFAVAQTISTHTVTTSIDLAALEASDPVACGTAKQYDIYYNDADDQATVAGGILNGPNDPTEHLVPGGSGVAYGTLQGVVCPPVPQACVPSSSVSTSASANGWATEDTAPKYTNNTLEYYTPNPGDKVNYYNRNVAGTPLWGVDGLGYSLSGAGGPQSSYQLEIYTTGTGGYDSLVWEPYQNGFPIAGDGSIKTYNDLENGQWWSTHSIPGDVGSNGSNQLLTTLTAIELANPNAKIIGQAVSQGSNNAGSDYFLASSKFDCNTTTFPNVPAQPEPIVTSVPATAVDCESNTQTTVTTTTTTDYVYDASTNTYSLGTPVVTTDAPGVTVPLDNEQRETCIVLTITPPTHTGPTCTAGSSDTLGVEGEGLKYALLSDGSRPVAGQVITLAPGATEDITVHSLADLGPTYEAVSQTFHLVGAGPDTSLCPAVVTPPTTPNTKVLGFTGDNTPYFLLIMAALAGIAVGAVVNIRKRRKVASE